MSGKSRLQYPEAATGVQQSEAIYKTVGGPALRLCLFSPEAPGAPGGRPCIVFFHGGGWVRGTPEQFFPQCAHLASRGMVAISAEYRISSRHGTTPIECVYDGRSAVRWIRSHAMELDVNPEHIAAGGGSAGGHVATCAAMVDGFDEPGEDTTVRCRPDALALFNPVLDTSQEAVSSDSMQGRGIDLSPLHHVLPGLPPTIIFHGDNDKTVPVAHVRRFAQAMRGAGNDCELRVFPGKGHGFYIHGREQDDSYGEVLRAVDSFLVKTGFLRDKP